MHTQQESDANFFTFPFSNWHAEHHQYRYTESPEYGEDIPYIERYSLSTE